MGDPGPAVVVMTPAAAGERALRESLGPVRADALAAALRAEVERWATRVAPGGVGAGEGALSEATARALAARGGPLLVVWPVLARFRAEHASGALDDLDAGADLVIGPALDGGLYLMGLNRPLGELIDVPDDAWSGEDGVGAALQGAAASGLEVGMLRAERALRQPSDVRAALADPLTPDEIGRILTGLKSG